MRNRPFCIPFFVKKFKAEINLKLICFMLTNKKHNINEHLLIIETYRI